MIGFVPLVLMALHMTVIRFVVVGTPVKSSTVPDVALFCVARVIPALPVLGVAQVNAVPFHCRYVPDVVGAVMNPVELAEP